MTTHTPGPWTAIAATGLGTPAYEPAKVVSEHAPFLHIATVEFPVHNDYGDAIETDEPSGLQASHARLIAAAPDLLEALREAMDAVKVFHGPIEWETYRDHSPEMKRWRAAIVKATGSAA